MIVRSVFLQGLLATGAPLESLHHMPPALSSYVAEFRAEADAHNLSLIDYALTFIRNVPGIDGVIIGCDPVSQVRESSEFTT